MSSNITIAIEAPDDCFLSGFVEASVEKPADGLNGECLVHYSGKYNKCMMKVKLVRGKRDGLAMILNDGVPWIRLTYCNGAITGKVERLNKWGMVDMRGVLVDGVENGLFKEYDKKDKVVWMGYYRNGQRYSEVTTCKRMKGWYEERSVENRELLSIAQYDEDLHEKNGPCMEYENGEWVGEWMYESGVKGRCVREYRNGKLQLYDANGKMTYEGSFAKEDVKDGFYGHEPMEGMSGYCKEVNSDGQVVTIAQYDPLQMKKNGQCFEMKNGKVTRVCEYKNGRRKRTLQSFNGSTMMEYDNDGKKVYEGAYKGDMKSGFVREGKGKEYGIMTNRSESVTLIGNWKNGKKNGEFYEVDMNEKVKRMCVYENDEMSRVTLEFSGTTMTEYNEHGKRVYEGDYKGDLNNGFMKSGSGKEYDRDGLIAIYSGEWKKGKREGLGTEYSQGFVLYTGEWKNGMRDGEGKEMDESGKVVFVGEWKDGKGKGKEMDGDGNAVYEGEWRNGKRNGVGEVLKGTRWMGHWKDGKMNGMEYEKDGNGVMKRGCSFENGEMKRVVQEFDEGKMVEYDENGKKVYEGEYKGGVEKGFVRNGKGKEFRMVEERKKPTNSHSLFSCWVREVKHEVAGVELVTKKYREEFVEGYWKNGKNQAIIVPSSLKTDSLGIEELRTGDKGYNDDSVTEFKLSWLVQLKRIVIGKSCFGKVRVFELDGLDELESVVIGERSFSIGGDEQNDGSYRIVNCPKLKSIQIGYQSFQDYHSFALNNLPSLQSIEIGDWCFNRAPSFSLTGLIDGLV